MSDEPSLSDPQGFLASLGIPQSQQSADPSPPAYRRVSPTEAARMFRLAQEGVSVPTIAEELGRHHRTVYETLALFEESVDAARKRMESLALPAAETLADTMKPGVNDRVRMESATKVLETVGIAPVGDSKGHSVQVAVVIGGPSQPPDFIKP